MKLALHAQSFSCLLPLAGWMCLAVLPARGHAKIFSTHEETIARVGDLSDERQSKVNQDGKTSYSAVGYKYQHFEILWVTFWTWGGDWCIYNAKEAEPAESKSIDSWKAAEYLDVERIDLYKPFQYKFPPGLFVLGGLIIAYAGCKMICTEERHVKRLFRDERYRHAITLIQDQAAEDERKLEAACGSAAQYLESQGIRRDVAEENLERLVRAILAHPATDPQAASKEQP